MLCLIILLKNMILDIFYNGLTDASRDYLDSCVGSLFRERTLDEAEILLNNMLTNENNWAPPEPAPEPAPAPINDPIPKPTPKKRGVIFLSPEDMQEAKKSMKEKGIKAEDVKNLPPIEEIHGINLPPVEETYDLNPSPIEETHGLDNPTQVVKVNSLYRFDEGDIPHYKSAKQCLEEFDNFIVKQENFNAYFGRQLKYDSDMIKRLGDYMANIRGELKLVSKHASMVTTQVEQVLKARKDLLNELNSKKNDYAVRVATRTGKMTQEPLYPEGRPKRIEQDSQRNNINAPSPSKKKKNKNYRTLHTSSEPIAEPPENPNDISIFDT